MPESLTVLLDQNVPRAIAQWLRVRRAQWTIYHTSDVALSGRPDEDIFAWAQRRQAVILTFDEDFVDQRSFPLRHIRERRQNPNLDRSLGVRARRHRHEAPQPLHELV